MTKSAAPRACNCCCGCKKPFSPEEEKYYAELDVNLETALCMDCQDEYERETDAKEKGVA